MDSPSIKSTAHIMEVIREKINAGFWKCGDRIWTENEFVENLGVRRVAVRQAIERLCVMSILRKVQGSGTYVEDAKNLSLSSLLFLDSTHKDLLDILYFRLSFEDANIELFLKNSTAEDMEDLAKYRYLMNENRDNKDLYYKYDFMFHKTIAKGTHNKIVNMISELIFEVLEKNQRIIQNVYIELGISNKKAYDVHDLIYQYLVEKDEKIAKAMMHRHIFAAINALETGKAPEHLR